MRGFEGMLMEFFIRQFPPPRLIFSSSILCHTVIQSIQKNHMWGNKGITEVLKFNFFLLNYSIFFMINLVNDDFEVLENLLN